MYYLIAPEIDKFLPFEVITNYYNSYGLPINVRKDMAQFLRDIDEDEKDKNRYEKMILFYKYCMVYSEQLKQSEIKNSIKDTRKAKSKKQRLPRKFKHKDYNIIPKSSVILQDLLIIIGFDVRSKSHENMGRLKIIPNAIKYNISTDKILGDSILLNSYYSLEEDQIAKELAAHPLFDVKYKKKSYKQSINRNSALQSEKVKSTQLTPKLSGLRADPSFL
eukprot:UN06569